MTAVGGRPVRSVIALAMRQFWMLETIKAMI
jgi:hypothetical protein